MTNGEKFDQVFGVGQANLAIAACSWWDEEYTAPKCIVTVTELSDSARSMLMNCPELINKFAKKIDSVIDNWDAADPDGSYMLKPIEVHCRSEDIQELLQHVGYTDEQCGYGENGK